MKTRITFTKRDVVVCAGCVLFLLANLGAVGQMGSRRAKEAVCLANLSKWGSVFLMYADDNEGRFMAGWQENLPVGCEDYWMEALREYYKEPDLRLCPEATVLGSDIGMGPYGGCGTFVGWGRFENDWTPPIVPGDYGSYANNAYICDPPAEVKIIQGHPTANNWRGANVAGAEDIPLIMDGQWVDTWTHHTDDPPDYEGQPWGVDHHNGMLRVCMNRHSGYVGSGFLDGSARKVGLKELWTLKWHRTFDLDYPLPDWPDWMEGFED